MNFVLNFVQNSNFRPNFVQLLKGTFNLQRYNYVRISKYVKRNTVSLSSVYITVDLFHLEVRVLLTSALILYCATSMHV